MLRMILDLHEKHDSEGHEHGDGGAAAAQKQFITSIRGNLFFVAYPIAISLHVFMTIQESFLVGQGLAAVYFLEDVLVFFADEAQIIHILL